MCLELFVVFIYYPFNVSSAAITPISFLILIIYTFFPFSLSFAEIRGEKGFEKNKKPCFSLKITLPKLNRANAYFYSLLLIQRGQTSLMFFIKSRPVAGEY